MEIKQTEVLSPDELSRGPDIFRPGTPRCILDPVAKTFIYTKYVDEEGNRWFCEPAEVGHEHIISRPHVLRALFGPKFKEIEDEISLEKEIYQCDRATGLPILNDNGLVVVAKEKFWDHWKIRLLSRETNLYGRAGHVKGRLAVMLWTACEDWEAKLDAVLGLLSASDDDLITVGSSWQFLVKDYRSCRLRVGRNDE